MESRIILDGSGAEKLVGRGDMLYQPIGAQKQTRVQGCLISSKEVEDVVAHVKLSAQAEYSDELLTQVRRGAEEVGVKKNGSGGGGAEPAASEEGDYDSLLPAAIEIVVETGQASASMLQRRLKLGYSRAARIIDQMEEKGVIGPYDGSKPRQVLIAREDEE
jgi:S-DNA-T family DNA segregation ATPase FtsK/SpoIIIE